MNTSRDRARRALRQAGRALRNPKIPLSQVEALARASGAEVEVAVNGTVILRGAERDLRQIGRVIAKRWKKYPSIYTAYTIDGVSLPGYPQLRIHPQVVEPLE